MEVLQYFINSRLVYFLVQKKKTCDSHRCSCRSVASETQTSQHSKFKTFLPPPPNYVWTVEQDPIYEDILDLKTQSNNATMPVTSGTAFNNKTSGHEVKQKSSVQYGVITAKEVAKFVPCSEIVNSPYEINYYSRMFLIPI